MAFTLYAPQGCYQAQKTLVTAQLCGLKVVCVNDFDAESASFKAMSPMGKAPVLDSAEGPLSEPNAMMRYLASLRPENHLFSKSFFGHAQVDQWVDWCASDLEVARGVCDYAAAYDSNVMGEGQKALAEALATLEAHLLEETFVVGNGVTVADVACACVLMGCFVKGYASCEKYPNTTRWLNTLVRVPAFSKVLGDKVGKAEEKKEAPKKEAPKEAAPKKEAKKQSNKKGGPPPAAGEVHPEVAAAAEKVRQLKADKAGKAAIGEAVKELLALKTKHGVLPPAKKGKGGNKKSGKKEAAKPAAAPAAAAAAPALPAEVQAAADKVRELKTAKADVVEIKAAVANLLALKEKHGIVAESNNKKKKKKKKSKN